MDIQTPLQSLKEELTPESAEQPAIIEALKKPFEKKKQPAVWKIVAAVVIGLAVVAGAVAFLIMKKAAISQQSTIPDGEIATTPQPSQAWVTYTNTNYSFTIEYPADWQATEGSSGDAVMFKPQNSLNTPGVTDDITLSVGQKTMTEEVLTFEEYARVAATKEIQNYNSLSSIEPVKLADGTLGYKTTWMVQSIVDHTAPERESDPITYFQMPGSETQLLRIASGHDVDPAVYDRMIKSVVFSTVSTAKLPAASPAGKPTPSPSLQPAATAAPTPTPTPGANEEAALEATIKEQILADSSGDGSTLTVSVSKISGDYAQGMASDDGGGGMWFAAKVDGKWQLVWDGNGIIQCSDLTAYPDYPASIIPECYDMATETSVKR